MKPLLGLNLVGGTHRCQGWAFEVVLAAGVVDEVATVATPLALVAQHQGTALKRRAEEKGR